MRDAFDSCVFEFGGKDRKYEPLIERVSVFFSYNGALATKNYELLWCNYFNNNSQLKMNTV